MTNFRSGLARVSLLALALGLAGCSALQNSEPKEGEFPGGVVPPADKLYAQGVDHLQKGDYDRAAQDFNAEEENYPYSVWASHAELLAGYAQYKQQNYDDAISTLTRFIGLHPASPEAAYAYYLKALCYYEQIEDVQRDQTTTYEAIQTLQDVINRFPDSAYARDARIKLRLAYNRLAGHDMEIGRFYEKQHLYAAAVGRFQDVATNYQTTTYAPEALERLVECYLDLGLSDAAVRTASVLGYNYPGSSWYEAAYDKLQDHGLVTAANEAQAASGGNAPPPPPAKHHWFWIF